MRKEFIIQFYFKTPLHISNERADYSSGECVIQSDTLLAAVYHSWARLGKAEWINEDALSESPLLLSSMFPFASDKKEQTAYFFPRPLIGHYVRHEEIKDPVKRKKMKKVQWIDEVLLNALISGQELPGSSIYGQFQSVHDGLTYPIIHSNVIPRVTVPRNSGETTVFYTERHYFSEGCGLYAIVQASEETMERLQVALNLLREEGIGTDRNVGNGKFDFSVSEQLPVTIGNGEYGISLGLYCPDSQEALTVAAGDPITRYDLVRRGGWLSEPYGSWRKKRVYMFKPGSFLKINQAEKNSKQLPYMGKLVDVRPTGVMPAIQHPVYRNGRTLFLPVKI